MPTPLRRGVLVASILLWTDALVGCSSGGKNGSPPTVVGPDPSGLSARLTSGIDVRYGADQTTLAVGDLNEDGRLDLAVAYYTAGRVGLFLGMGGGGFEALPEIAAGAGPWKVALADVDGDGHLDLITANHKSGSVSVLLGNGDGTFQPSVDFPTGAGSGWVEVADLDGDGKRDLVVSASPFEFGGLVLRAYQGSSAVGVLLGNGDGTFGAITNVATGTGLNVVAVGDLNGDGVKDLVVADAGAGGLRVLLGRGDGTFASARTYASGPSPRSLALGDLDGDGKLDAVAADFAVRVVSVFMGRGDGTFSDRMDFQAERAPASVTLGDVDGDGKADVVIATLTALDLTFYRPSQRIGVFFGKGDGTFRGEIHSSAVVHPYFAVLSDLDSDGQPELAVTNLGYLDYFTYPYPYFAVGVYRVGGGSPLTVSPARAGGISPGGVPVTFAASAGGVARDVDWSLSPAIGSLSGLTGTSVSYTPPATVDAPAAVRLIATSGVESVTASISLSAQVARPLGSTSAPNGFLEYLPSGYDDGQPRPLLVFLQGVAGNGNGTTDLAANLTTWAVPAMIAYGGWPAGYPFIVLSPQHTGSDCASGAEVHAFITWAMANYRVDPQRVYLTGLSCGSNAAWDYLGSFTDSQVAAAVLLAGNPGSAWSRAGCNLGKAAIWAIHGSLDNPEAEQTVMNQLAACPAPPRRDIVFTLVPGGSHYIFDDVYLGRLGYDAFGWLLAHPKP